MRFTELLQAAERVPAPVKVKGRRRPGRNDRVNPYLIPLLRNPATMDIPAPHHGEVDPSFVEDDYALVKYIGVGLVLSAPLWAIIGAVVWVTLRWIG